MRRLMFLLVLAAAAPAAAQDTAMPTTCHPVSPTTQVVMTLKSGEKVQGTLLCLSEHDVLMAGAGSVIRRPLGEVRQIDKPRDRVEDGFLKGAAIGLIFWALTDAPSEYGLRFTTAYAFMGLSLDALQGNGGTIYRGSPGPKASIGWSVRW